MWQLPLSRRELVEALSPRGWNPSRAFQESRPSLDMVRPDQVVAVWPMSPTEFGPLPTTLVVHDGEQRDTLAWLATYVRDLRPFTAFCRVVERSTAERFLSGPSSPHLNEREGMFAGLVLGESLAHSQGRSSTVSLPATAYSATLSHAIGRAFALTGGSIATDDVARRWSRARETTGQSALGVPVAAIVSVWSVALGTANTTSKSRGLFDGLDLLRAAWADWSNTGAISDSIWTDLASGNPALGPMRSIQPLPREQRVEAVDAALRPLGAGHREHDERHAFLAGYCTSLVAPGTLEHADILLPVAASLPTAYLWYGLFAGTNTRGDSLPVGNPLARRIVREMTLPDRLVDRPRCDVALEELALASSADTSVRLTSRVGRLDVDILPGVTVPLRWPAREEPEGADGGRARERELQHLLTEMDEVGARWSFLRDRLRELMQLGEGGRALNLRRKRGK